MRQMILLQFIVLRVNFFLISIYIQKNKKYSAASIMTEIP